jgi:hypothetical protein
VTDPVVLDSVVRDLPATASVLRFARDEALIVGLASLRLDDPDAIVEPDRGWSAVTVERALLERHTEWRLPAAGEVAQGAVAGVPAKLAWLPDGRAWIVVQTAYLDELLDRLT